MQANHAPVRFERATNELTEQQRAAQAEGLRRPAQHSKRGECGKACEVGYDVREAVYAREGGEAEVDWA